MRTEIIQALQAVAKQNDTYDKWREQHPIPNPRPAHYQASLPPEHEQAFEKISTRLSLVRKCCCAFSAVYAATSTSISIEWDVEDKTHNNVVVECSMDATLAAIFPYGDLPPGLLQHIENCVIACGLLPLTKEEIHDLEQQEIYHKLF